MQTGINLATTYPVTLLVPGWDALPILAHVLITTLCLTPIMTYVMLLVATRLLRPWLAPAK